MTEIEYVDATNLTKARMAVAIVLDFLPTDDQDESDQADAARALRRIADRLDERVNAALADRAVRRGERSEVRNQHDKRQRKARGEDAGEVCHAGEEEAESLMACYKLPGPGVGFICGNLGPHCTNCYTVSNVLCDYPVGDGKTCDRAICQQCAHEVAPDVHYCHGHYAEWERFRDSGGVRAELENVMPFKSGTKTPV